MPYKSENNLLPTQFFTAIMIDINTHTNICISNSVDTNGIQVLVAMRITLSDTLSTAVSSAIYDVYCHIHYLIDLALTGL